MRKCLVFVAASVLASGWFAARASAEPAEPTAGISRASEGLSPDQLKAFGDLTGDSPYRISGRLAAEPNLIPLAAKAADARRSRKATGLVLTIVGFTILGVGEVASTVILVSTPGYPKMTGHEDRFLLSAGIALGSLAVGLGLGIPGILKMVRPSEEEQRALDAYSPTRPDLAARPVLSPGRTLVAPLFGMSF